MFSRDIGERRVHRSYILEVLEGDTFNYKRWTWLNCVTVKAFYMHARPDLSDEFVAGQAQIGKRIAFSAIIIRRYITSRSYNTGVYHNNNVLK